MKHMAKHALLCPAVGLVLALGSAACVSRNPNTSNHWSFESVEASVRQHVFGHSSSDPNALRDAYLGDFENVMKTLTRHVMNDNPDNPLLPRTPPPSVEYELPPGGFQPSGS